MEFTTLEVSGSNAVRLLEEYRSRYRSTGQYPFMIGDGEELERLINGDTEQAAEIIQASLAIDVSAWIAKRREDAEDIGYSSDEELLELLGEWPIKAVDQGSISQDISTLHKNIVNGIIKPKVYLGLAKMEQPWHLPAVIDFAGWNSCPFDEVHCAFHRSWQERFGAEITGMSGDTVECVVRNPPRDKNAALDLAWEQYWYCTDIVDQGCQSISNLAATLLNSPYWFFWWD
jgi:hypothetical protein